VGLGARGVEQGVYEAGLEISREDLSTPLRFGRGDREMVGDRGVSDLGVELHSVQRRYRTVLLKRRWEKR